MARGAGTRRAPYRRWIKSPRPVEMGQTTKISAQQDQLRHGVCAGPDDGVLVESTAQLPGLVEWLTQGEPALLGRPVSAFLAAGDLDDAKCLRTQQAGQFRMGALIGGVGLDGSAWAVGSEERLVAYAFGSAQCGKVLRALTDGEGDVLCGVAEPVVCGEVGPDIVGMDLRRFRHTKPSRESVEGRHISRLVAHAEAASAFAIHLAGRAGWHGRRPIS